MTKKRNGLLVLLYWIVGVITTVGIADLFINGGTFAFLPLIVYKISGWIILITAVLGVIQEFFSK
ncbi:MAG: hypothetical protein AABY22_16885 [Nanoarchaeota archaeon]